MKEFSFYNQIIARINVLFPESLFSGIIVHGIILGMLYIK